MAHKTNSKKTEPTSQDIRNINVLPQETGDPELDKVIEIAGYSYDPKQDIFFSDMDPWQRHVGYCHLYDEAAAPMGMIIDTEPIFFEYRAKKWMIGLWKGQYDLVTGAEIGIYVEAVELDIPSIFKGTLYKAVNDAELLQMSYTLKKNGTALFTREGEHWWLTGFKLGEFSEPSELTMDIKITLANTAMRDAFVTGFKRVGYSDDDFTVNGNQVSFTFATPHTPQPASRQPATDWIIQRKNEEMCKLYQEITGPYNTVPEKLKAIETEAPDLYKKINSLGKSKLLYEIFTLITLLGSFVLSLLGKSEEVRKFLDPTP